MQKLHAKLSDALRNASLTLRNIFKFVYKNLTRLNGGIAQIRFHLEEPFLITAPTFMTIGTYYYSFHIYYVLNFTSIYSCSGIYGARVKISKKILIIFIKCFS